MICNNNPFVNDGADARNDQRVRISLDEAKRMIPRVSMVEFYNAFQQKGIPTYLHDCYYMHYLCIIGDLVALNNFVLHLRERNLNVTKIVNYNKLPELDYGTCFHTAVRWNDDTDVAFFIKEHCNANPRAIDKYGFSTCELSDLNNMIYVNPFLEILGHGEKPMDVFVQYRRRDFDFLLMAEFMKEVEEEIDAEDEIRRRGGNQVQEPVARRLFQENENQEPHVEEQEEQQQEVIVIDNNNDEWVIPLERQNAVRPLYESESEEEQEEEEEEDIKIIEPPSLQDSINKENYDFLKEKVIEMEIDEEHQEQVIKAFDELGIYNQEDLIEPYLEAGDLEKQGIKEQDIIDKVWSYIEKKSPNFFNGVWLY